MRPSPVTALVGVIVLAVGLPMATAGNAGPPATPTSSAALPAAHLVADRTDCGAHMYRLVIPQLPRYLGCTHGPDPLIEPAEAALTRAVGAANVKGGKPAGIKPKCYGDGVSGPRVQLIYMSALGEPDRAKSRTGVGYIRDVIIPRMNGVVVRAAGKADRHIRFVFAQGCSKPATVVSARAPHSVIANRDAGAELGAAIAYLDSLGFNKPDRRYEIFLDSWTQTPACGLGSLVETETGHDLGLPLPLPIDGDSALPTNPNNGFVIGPNDPAGSFAYGPAEYGTQGVSYYNPAYAMIYGPGISVTSCWNGGYSGALAPVHELFHTLGAVQRTAPYSDGGAHCIQIPDVMCYGAGSYLVPACQAQLKKIGEPLDCGKDDYFNAAADPTSYLGTHWDTANSVFLGPDRTTTSLVK
jgi:hypothetical protein